jgi:hypothetical protein
MQARLLAPDEIPWDVLDRFSDRTVFQTREWLAFLAETQHATPLVAEVRDGSCLAGYFTGLMVRRFGIPILGSSFPGWTTPYIGFNLVDGASRRESLQAVEDLAFRELKCLHMEVSDRHFHVQDGAAIGFRHKFFESYETDLRETEDQLFSRMESSCRRCIRKAEKSGVRVEQARDSAFADDYYAQLMDVYSKQKLVPSYTVDRVRALIKHLLPTGRLLLIRAMSPDGKCIGTGIYPACGSVAEFWGNASFRSTQILRPNEALHWYAMRYWKARGVEVFDWGGRRSYKEKFGPTPISVPWFYRSRYRILGTLRSCAEQAVRLKHRIAGRLSPIPTGHPNGT